MNRSRVALAGAVVLGVGLVVFPAGADAPPSPEPTPATSTPVDCADPMVECECDHYAHDPARDCDPATLPTTPPPAVEPDPPGEEPTC